MKEKHYAYKITPYTSGLNCPHSVLQNDKMIGLLKEIESQHSDGIFWIFKQSNEQPQEALCIVDCEKKRIYFHYSGEVENLNDTIANLNH